MKERRESMYLVFEAEDITEGVNGSDFLKNREISRLLPPAIRTLKRIAKELARHRASLRIIKLRMESNTTREKYAKKVGFNRTALARLERGKGTPNLSTLIELAHQNGYEVDIQLKPFGY